MTAARIDTGISMSIASPYELLKQLDERCRRNSSGLPVARGVIEDWLGIGFAIDDMPLLASMDEVEEILMPVLDMNHYLNGKPTQLRKESRVLVVNNQGLLAALLVDEVFGLRRFKPEEHLDEAPAEAGNLGDYLSGMFIDQVRRWSVFSVEKLTRADAFLRVVAG